MLNPDDFGESDIERFENEISELDGKIYDYEGEIESYQDKIYLCDNRIIELENCIYQIKRREHPDTTPLRSQNEEKRVERVRKLREYEKEQKTMYYVNPVLLAYLDLPYKTRLRHGTLVNYLYKFLKNVEW